MKLRIQAQHLQPGDIVGSGEKVIKCSAGVKTPRDKVEVYLKKNDNIDTTRMTLWGKYTMINVEREEVKISCFSGLHIQPPNVD